MSSAFLAAVVPTKKSDMASPMKCKGFPEIVFPSVPSEIYKVFTICPRVNCSGPFKEKL